jgi:hypothetical protein
MGRVNESAELSGWAVRLTWRGFTPTDGTAPPEIDERIAVQIAQAMDSLLRRFERVDGASPGDSPPAGDRGLSDESNVTRPRPLVRGISS